MACNNQMMDNLNANLLGVTPWHCPICNGYFSTKASLQRHTNEVHIEQTHLYHCPEVGCTYLAKRRSDLLKHHRIHLKNALNFSPTITGKAPSSFKIKMVTNRNNPVENSTNGQATVSTNPETLESCEYQVTPHNTVNLEEFHQLMGGLNSCTPQSSNNHNTVPYNVTSEKSSSTSVTIFNPPSKVETTTATTVEMQKNIDEINEQIQEEAIDLSLVVQQQENEISEIANKEITETLNTEDNIGAINENERESDTPSPIEYCEGQIYILNQSMQFVRLHANVGDKFIITSKGLEKFEEETDNLQTLTLKGKFSFQFETQ
jgi:hypothetical protein